MRAARESLKPNLEVPPSRVRRTHAERSNEARAILIDVAIQHIREKGLAYVTMAEIADQAGMTRGAIQHHFGSRDNYMRAVLAALTDRVESMLANQPPPNTAASDLLIRHCVEALGRIILSREQLAVTDISISSRSVPLLLADSQRTSDRMKKIYAAAWRRWLGGFYPSSAVEKAFVIFSTWCSGLLVINYGETEPNKQEEMLALCVELVENTLTT